MHPLDEMILNQILWQKVRLSQVRLHDAYIRTKINDKNTFKKIWRNEIKPSKHSLMLYHGIYFRPDLWLGAFKAFKGVKFEDILNINRCFVFLLKRVGAFFEKISYNYSLHKTLFSYNVLYTWIYVNALVHT